MGKNKLMKFSQLDANPLVLQFPFSKLESEGFDKRGHWNESFFATPQPIVLELGCGKGEYTVGLAGRFADRNHIGIDIKGARMWSGAKMAQERSMTNAGFLRTSIELIDRFFAPDEVSEIWITFPDPQMKKQRKRLTSTRFLELYRRILKDRGRINLKTDSPFLYAYTRALCEANPGTMRILADTDDLYARPDTAGTPLDLRTHYEQQWLARGKTIKYLAFELARDGELVEIDDTPFERDDYRSYHRDAVPR